MSNKRPYVKEDLFRMNWLHSADLNLAGTHIVYAQSEYYAETDSDITNLWLLEISNGKARRLTSGANTDGNPVWSPDGATISFLSNRTGKQQIYLLTAATDDVHQLTDLPNGVHSGAVWSPDGARIAFTAGQQNHPPKDLSKPYRVTRYVYRANGIGSVQKALNHVSIVEVATGQLTQLTNNCAINGNLRWSPDGSKLLFTRSLDADSFVSVRPNIVCVDMSGNESTIIPNSEFAVSSFAWHTDNKHIVFAGTPTSKLNGSKADIYVTDLARTSLDNRTPTLPMGTCGRVVGDMPARIHRAMPKIIMSADGNSAWCEVQRGGDAEINQIELAGPEKVDRVLTGERRLRLLDINQETQAIFYMGSDINQPADLYLSQIDGSKEQQMTAVNGHILPELKQATVRRLLFPGIDGVEVEGWHVAPDDSKTAWPTVLYIHGGPHSAFGNQYRFDTHMLLGAGFAVLMINHRASIGYDDAFATGIYQDWGNLEYHDQIYGVDKAIAEGLTDPDRLGVTGMSGGGYLSCWIVGQTHRFKAAVPENPLTNWTSFYGVSDAGVWLALEELGGHPHEVPELYAKCSPITYAHNCTTPTLLIQGEHDWRCTPEQSEQFYTVLKINGCEVEMLRLPGASHFGSIDGPPPIRRAQNDGLLDWMTRYVL